MNKEFSVIGKSVIREDAFDKVTGKAKFADDYKFDEMLYAKMIRIKATHAKINSIDFSEIENQKDIYVITANDVKGKNLVGLIKHDQPIFCNEKVVTPGDVIAMIVGEDEDKLEHLAKKVKVNFTPLPTLTDPTKALDPDSVLIHPEEKSNLIIHHPLRKGDIEKGFSESDEILEQTYTTQLIEHAYIEPESVIAIPKEDGIKIIGSIQNPFTTRRIVSLATDLPLEKIEVIQAQLGGSFGGKDDTMCILSARAAVASLKTNKPIKIKYTREESILESYKRHPYILNYKVGYTKDGKIKAMKIDILADGGAYCSMSPFVTWRTVVQATGPYEIENVHTDVRAVYTNNPYTGAMRGFGSPQPIFAQESLMDEIAIRLGITPDEIRRINGYKNGSVTATGQKLQNHDVNILTVLNKAVALTNFSNKWKEYKKEKSVLNEYEFEKPILKKNKFIDPKKLYQKGIGLAVSFRGCSLGAEGLDETYCYMSIEKNGLVKMLTGLAENGQGLRTTLIITAAETLGIIPDKIQFLETNTSLIKDSGPTVASRGTIMGTGSVKNAAEILKERLIKIVKKGFHLDDNDVIDFRENLVFSRKKGLLTNFDFVCQLALEQKENLTAIGYYKSPEVHWNEHNGQGDAYFTYVYGCQVAEVTVNIGTGEVFLNKITAVHDPGTVINRLGALGQIFGGVTQGAGYGIFEEITHEDGMIRELNFDQYLIPTAKDIDEIKPYFVEGNDIYGGYGAKSLGEPTLELTAAAIANAIRNATGKRFFNLPINLEELVLGKKIRPQNLNRGSL
ncbi:MAG: xanthine dehydrogenase family protein molybdopterin-binding subunit [Melioribacteraceae bacterium]|nr:xanthine dehydrogenase family protein molybdopterin-binding subunit [Melioribacteraceae bacterium]